MFPLALLSKSTVHVAGCTNATCSRAFARVRPHACGFNLKYMQGLILTMLLDPLSAMILRQPFDQGKHRC